jgi:Ni/Co efflux regulator RcnB
MLSNAFAERSAALCESGFIGRATMRRPISSTRSSLMRKFILSALIAATAATGLTGVASAQTQELRRDRQQVREQQRDLREAQARGSRRDVRAAREDLRDARRETREDWRDYRRSNGDVFRGPAYVGPRGYRYRPVTTGYRLQPAYYGSRYVIADPYRYRLPRATAPHRWVRYGNDVVLVNTRTGRVVQVHDRFFF